MRDNGISASSAVLRLIGFFRHHWKTALTGATFLFLSSVATVVTPRILGEIVDRLQHPGGSPVMPMIALLAINELIRVSGSGASGIFLTITGQRALHRMRTAIMEKLFNLPVREIHSRTPAALVSHVTTDVGALTELFSTGFVESIEKFLIVGGITISILSLNLRLGALLLSAFLILFVIATVVTTRLHRYYRELRAAVAALQGDLGESLLGVGTIRLFGFLGHRDDVIRMASKRCADAELRAASGFAVFHPTVTLVNGTSMVLLITVGGTMVREGAISFGTLVALSSYILWLFWPIMHIVDRWKVLLSGSAAAQRIFDLLDSEEEPTLGSDSLPRTLSGSVRFDSVSFGYQPQARLFEDLSFEVPSGARVAIVGATGSGKTTIANLLLRLWEVNGGRILLDGVAASAVPVREVRGRFGLIEQELYLFAGTIGENITLWGPEDSERLAELRRRLPQLPDLSRPAAERGANLSMGERQLVSLARALYARPQILILDEATAHLDPVLDRELQRAMRELSGGVTTFIIAHRISTIVDADRIFVLHHGTLIEQGSHAELLRAGGIYAKLLEIEHQEQGADR